MELKSKISLIIPTHNRPQYLSRSLKYWTNFDINIFVTDSSTSPFKNLPKEIIYTHCPSSSFTEKISKTLKKIKTEYCFLCADDDFITLNGITDALKFLEKNSDYLIAHGDYYSFFLNPNSNKDIEWSKIYIGNSINHDEPVQRLDYHFKNYICPTFYGVHRTWALNKIWNFNKKNSSDNRFSELLPTMLSVIYGKVKRLNGFYCAREKLLNKTTVPDIFNFINEKKYDEKYRKFKKCLSVELSNICNLPQVETDKIIENGMEAYINDIKKSKSKPNFLPKLIIIKLLKTFRLYNFLIKTYKNLNYYNKIDSILSTKEYKLIEQSILKNKKIYL